VYSCIYYGSETAVIDDLYWLRSGSACPDVLCKVNPLISFRGVYAALLSPRASDGELDTTSFRQQVVELSRFGLRGYAINGATGEFTIVSDADVDELVRVARQETPEAEILCGIGAGDLRLTVRRARVAQLAGAHAALLPMPNFFPYREDDLAAYISAVASSVELPILLYNLPQFTSGLDVDTVLSLFAKHSNIVGIKDSSGSLDIVRAITAAGLTNARLIGNDSALSPALTEGVCDGVVSGVACTLPELLSSLFATGGHGSAFETKSCLLNEFIDHLGPLPTPWGLKVTSAVRHFTDESYPFPLSRKREVEVAELREWFSTWYRQNLS
jgi:4-hydroxy-tetrahydrodipicolinate synthase